MENYSDVLCSAWDRLTSDSVSLMGHRFAFKEFGHIDFRLSRAAAMWLFWLLRFSYCRIVSVSFQTWNVQKKIDLNRFALDFGHVLLNLIKSSHNPEIIFFKFKTIISQWYIVCNLFIQMYIFYKQQRGQLGFSRWWLQDASRGVAYLVAVSCQSKRQSIAKIRDAVFSELAVQS